MTKSPLKLATALVFLSLVGTGLVGCGGESAPTGQTNESTASAPQTEEAPAPAPVPVDLTGTWKQTNSNSPDSFQEATITGDTIEIQWVAPDQKSLYWAGTVEVPEDGSADFSWESVNDTSKTDGALLASGDETKTFTYKDGELSYEVTALGTTMTVRLAQE
ncbi:hypothetical protein [Microbacterium sp. Bi121]|uniref:hypothetical protein n=1 Tax=Microbacterium sp. Bi121 TaxID=2822348 RepID=UPI001D8429D5|nr:hypothetical protein [Microbacterium sp. Bi121]CAH0123315.1 hypothetical protein SRABI121_00494 [Microbacterium sp. Bi121]